jgi:hypothetical protein
MKKLCAFENKIQVTNSKLLNQKILEISLKNERKIRKFQIFEFYFSHN